MTSNLEGEDDSYEAPLVNPVASEECPDDMEDSDSVHSGSEDDSESDDAPTEIAQNLNSSNTARSDDDSDTTSSDEDDDDVEDDDEVDDEDDDDDDDDKDIDDSDDGKNDGDPNGSIVEPNGGGKDENKSDGKPITIQQLNITMEKGTVSISGQNKKLSISNCDKYDVDLNIE
jgi:hypothetical protein